MRAPLVSALALAFVVTAVAAPSARAGECPGAGTYDSDRGATATAGNTSDPLLSRQWGLKQINAASAWSRGFDGEGVTVAVLDSGVDLHHPDLVANLVPGFDARETLDPDGCAEPADTTGHGTIVAGIVAASAGNGIGVSGVAPRARILPIKVCSAGSCAWAAMEAGIRVAVERGARVIQMSIGSPSAYRAGFNYRQFDAAVESAWRRGAVIVASAGNYYGDPLCGDVAAAPRVICVAATDRRGLPATYSNLPNDRDGDLTLRAPGGEMGYAARSVDDSTCDEGIWSTSMPTGMGACGAAYGVSAGTSFASPHVSGAVALLAQAGLTNEQIVERLRLTSSNRGAHDPLMGYGIPDLESATTGLIPVAATVATPSPKPPTADPATPPSGTAPPVRADPACAAAQRRLRKAVRRAVTARSTLRRARGARSVRLKRALEVFLGQRDRAQRSVDRACRLASRPSSAPSP